jgi:hypothetical protein
MLAIGQSRDAAKRGVGFKAKNTSNPKKMPTGDEVSILFSIRP